MVKKVSRGGDRLSKAKPLTEVEKFLVALFYGRSGTGKTTLYSTFPKPSLLLDFSDRGTDSIMDVEGIDYLSMDDWDDVPETFYALEKQAKYKSLCLDTVAGMQRLAIDKVREEHKIDITTALNRKNWGEVSGMLNTWLLNYRDLEMNVVFLAPDKVKHATEDDDENLVGEDDRIDPEVGPALIPSVALNLNAAVKIIGNTYIQQKTVIKGGKQVDVTHYMLRLGPHPYYITKVRSPKSFKIPPAIANPSYSKIQKIIKGEYYVEKK